MTFQKFIEQGHTPRNVIHGRMDFAEVVLFLLDGGFEIDCIHITTSQDDQLTVQLPVQLARELNTLSNSDD